jgi:hypothetical protein
MAICFIAASRLFVFPRFNLFNQSFRVVSALNASKWGSWVNSAPRFAAIAQHHDNRCGFLFAQQV